MLVSCLILQNKVEMCLPMEIGDYTDFFSSMHHAKNCGHIFRGPETPIAANWCVNLRFMGNSNWNL